MTVGSGGVRRSERTREPAAPRRNGAAALASTLAVLLPTPDETALLEACLHRGARAREAWARWRAERERAGRPLCDELAATRTLLPLLARSAVRNGLDPGPGVLPYLHAATVREELRSNRFRRIAAGALTTLGDAGVSAFVLRGAALAATVYESWALRHCHDLDLLVERRELRAGARALAGAGFTVVRERPRSRGSRVLEHSSGFRLALHTRPFAVPYYDAPFESFTAGAELITIDGVPAPAPAREATLVHVLGHASCCASRRNLRWVADAWHLLEGPDRLDWSQIIERVEAHRLALPTAVLLRYLARLGAGVPPEALMRIETLAAAADAAAVDAALDGAHAGPGGDLHSLWRATASRDGRLHLVRWAAAPAPAFMRSAYALPSDWLLPLCYIYRPARAVVRSLARRRSRAP